ncbi:hypothetical protein L5L55_17155 [Shewanella glacialipiscicola]|nr:hypothetical protein [Shewanella glacialipiscicola]MCU7996597.1 hypothetical protein [Shewanella glacialipiscicola]MCU8027910.1 hypothetical protein [Shewanella glacialipiscicola]
MLRLRLSTEHHYVFNPSPCLKRVELPLNEQIFNTIGIKPCNLYKKSRRSGIFYDSKLSSKIDSISKRY